MGGWGVPPVDERRVSRGLLSRRPELAGHPAHGVGLQGIDGEGNFLDQMAGAALESTLLKATFAWRDPSQSHPVLAGRTRWPLSNRNAHHPVSRANDRRGWEFWSVRFPTFSDKNLAQFLRGGNHSKKSELVPQVTVGCVTGTALALKPPYPRRGGSCLFGCSKPELSRFPVAPLG